MNALNFAIWASKSQKKLSSRMQILKNGQFNRLCIQELHVNLWKLDNKNSAIDIGIMFEKSSELDTINFFVDTKTEIKFEDLNGLLSDSCNMLYTIFNDFLDDCSCDVHFGSARKVRSHDGLERDTFCLFPISDEQYEIQNFSNGKIIKIKNLPITQTCKNCDAKNIYLRFRLTGDFIEKSFVNDESATSKLQNFTSKLTIIELKFNALRSLPPDIRKEIQQNWTIISKVNFFLMCPSNESIEISSSPYVGIRCLEGDIWDRYFSMIHSYESQHTKIFAYQWKTTRIKDELKDYSLLIRIKSDKLQITKVIFLFCFATFSSIIGSLIYNTF